MRLKVPAEDTVVLMCFIQLTKPASRSESNSLPLFLANMADRPAYHRMPSTNLTKTPAYRPHDGKFGIVTGGSRGER